MDPLTEMAVLIEHPWAAAAIGAVVAGLGWLRHRRAAIGAGVAWLLYAAYETGMQQRWLCSGECNIRLDLFLIYPLLLLGLVVAAISLVRKA